MATQNHKITIIDNETIERPMTDEEYASIKLEQDRIATEKAEQEAANAAKAEAKAALLDRLGITAEEAQLLLA